MSQLECRVRRATVDDLKGLVALWGAMRLPVNDLEPRLTEFQVAEAADGQLLGTIGIEITNRHGRLHSEAFNDFSVADGVRPKLWERMQSVATNHGLVRIWTQEEAPFWGRCGLHPATEDELKKLPPSWSSLPGAWLTLQLRDEAAIELSLDQEFERFKQLGKEETSQAMRHARILKNVATVIAIILAIFVMVAAFYMFKNRWMLPVPQQP